MNQNNIVSVIIVNYNGFKDTCICIESWINNIKSCQYEIIVIDNGSKEDECSLLLEKFDNIVGIRSLKNLGFAGANNLGMQHSKGDTLFFLNNDTIIFEDKLSQIIDQLYSNNKMAGISPIILNNNRERTLQYAGYTRLSNITLRNKTINDGKEFNSIIKANKTDFLHGAAMIFKKSAIAKVGKMDESYFLYYEEMDWCEKFKRDGYELWVSPAFKIIHNNSGSIGFDSPLKNYYLTRNRLLFAYKNRTKNKLFFIILYHLIVAYPYHIIIALLHGKVTTANSIINGITDFFKLIY